MGSTPVARHAWMRCNLLHHVRGWLPDRLLSGLIAIYTYHQQEIGMMPDTNRESSSRTTSEAGRAVRETHAREYYRQIGKKGGEALKTRRGSDHYRAIARKGGENCRDRHGSEHFARIGARGGNVTKERHGPDFYSRIGKLGGHPPKKHEQPS